MSRLLTAFVCVLVLTPSSFVWADEPASRPGGPRIRAKDSRAAKFLDLGLKRSATLRALVERIEASDVIVYVGVNPLMRAQLSGTLNFVTTSGGFRYVRAMLKADQVPDLVIATLAHELQHVVEVIDNPSVVDEQTLVNLYRRIGVANSQGSSITGWETTAAQAMGAQVRRELTRATYKASSSTD